MTFWGTIAAFFESLVKVNLGPLIPLTLTSSR